MEIKFRGKRIDNGEWVYGYYYKRDWENSSYIRVQKDQHFIDCKVKPETVGQFINLHDKNKKEIYVGDIMSCNNVSESYGVRNFMRKYGVIKFKNCFFCIDGKPQKGCTTYPVPSRHSNPCVDGAEYYQDSISDWIENEEIIGDIHTTPELLTNQTKEQ